MSVVCIGGTKGARGADLVSMLVSSALVPSIVGGEVTYFLLGFVELESCLIQNNEGGTATGGGFQVRFSQVRLGFVPNFGLPPHHSQTPTHTGITEQQSTSPTPTSPHAW